MDKSKVAAVIVSYNIGEKIYKCYDSIKNQVDCTIIVDNGSNESTVNELKKIEKNIKTKVIYLSNNKGIAIALNEGIKEAINLGYTWVITLDNDSKATENMVSIMKEAYDNLGEDDKKQIVSLAPRYIQEGEYFKTLKEYGISYESLVITSGNLVKTSIFEEIGFFNEEYFIDYVDNEFCLRILEANKKIIQVKEAVLEHNLGDLKIKKIFGKTIKSTNHSAIRRYYLTRNSMDVYYRYKKLNVRHINNTKRVLLKFIIQILLVEDEKFNKVKHMYWGYKDYKNRKFGEFNRK